MAKKLKIINLRLAPAIIDTIDEITKKDGQTRQSFIRMAINRALKNWKSPLENPNLWPPCRHCSKRHDPQMAHGE